MYYSESFDSLVRFMNLVTNPLRQLYRQRTFTAPTHDKHMSYFSRAMRKVNFGLVNGSQNHRRRKSLSLTGALADDCVTIFHANQLERGNVGRQSHQEECNDLCSRPIVFERKNQVLGGERIPNRENLTLAMIVHFWTQLIQRIAGLLAE
ncbi:hypothetical protein N7509_000221 [Penicillium cosmopolitanum]|uniref:Uncharacterized protein n=1 Tax=Penicillium cosmopolitanum TaxID=1131564 RepID=A0A9X0BF45_9EURO|nr:uncharacterized protein N7509_000221 [Penicillium cosmopolitanum]KAJ5414887.1 hypothetical protein N7509_000221 [Penicillium cosmopolitanum]